MRARNTLMISTIAVLAIGPAFSPALAQVDAAQPAKEDHFRKLDANGDGFIDKTEARGRLADHFDQIDTNHDGRLSPDELKAAHGARHGMKDKAGRLAMLDTDHDGKVSWAEFSAGIKTHFDRLDANHDGYLDAGELRTAHRHGGHHGGKETAGHWGSQEPAGQPAK